MWGYSENAMKFSDGLAGVKIGDKCGYIDKTGKVIINPQFGLAWGFSEGIAKVETDIVDRNEFGYIDKTGKYVWHPTK